MRWAVLLHVLLLPLFLACSDLAGPSRESFAPTSTDGIGATLLANGDDIHWAENRPLTWDDFTGTPDAASPLHASSLVGLATVVVPCDSGRTRLDIVAVFNKPGSWVKADQKTDALLAHEQGHFDISEVYARKARERVQKEVSDPCSEEGREHTQRIADEETAKENAEQEKYDKQTEHGTDPKKQQQWRDKIDKDLGKAGGKGGGKK